MRAPRFLLVLAPCAALGCGLSEGGSVGAGPDDAGLDGTFFDAAGGDASDGVDALFDAGPDVAVDAGDAGCPKTLAGPALVLAGDFCVDETEVTKAQYDRFLLAVADAGVPPLSPQCGWNKTLSDLTPSGWDPGSSASNPVTGVDWCDAYTYCAWAKKRLCGARAGGALAAATASNDTQSQWYDACSKGGTRTWAYGNTWDSAKCQDDAFILGGVADVKSNAQCEGGYSGLFDMTGNASEWIDQCDGPGKSDDCVTQGGNYGSNDSAAQCDAQEKATRDHDTGDWLGIRCCWP